MLKSKLLLSLTGSKATLRATSDQTEDQHAQERTEGLSLGKNIRGCYFCKSCSPGVLSRNTWTVTLEHPQHSFSMVHWQTWVSRAQE